jgi:mRNA-degrading endonuclease RelE of RelBE toxin-antitoxin system
LATASVEYKASALSDLDRLDRAVALRVLNKIEKSLAEQGGDGEPEPLPGEFQGLLPLRVGDHRVIDARTSVGYLVLRIGHRGDVYRRGRP